jgi:hypothetical protein
VVTSGAGRPAPALPAAAAAVALAAALGLRAGAVRDLAVGHVHQLPGTADAGAGQDGHTVIEIRLKGGATDHLPVPARVAALWPQPS